MAIFDRKPNVERMKKKEDINGLIKALNYQKDPSVRYAIASALGEIGNEQAVKPLIAALKDQDWQVRRCIVTALAKIGDERAVEPLIEALKDTNKEVCGRAATELAKIGDERAVEPLIDVLNDKDWGNRYAAALALAEIGNEQVVEPLIAALKDDKWKVRYITASALGTIGDERAIEPLIVALSDNSEDVREATATALGKIGDIQAVESLILTLKDQGSLVRRSAAWALEQIAGQDFGEDTDRWKQWWQDQKKEKKELSSQIHFGEATNILRFLKGSEKRFQNQVKFLKAAIGEKKYPYLRVVALKKSNPSATFEHLIVVSGSREEYRTMDSKTAEDIFYRIHPGKEMADMWADGVLADTPDPGNVLTDIRPFNELRDEIKNDWYSIEEILQEVVIGEEAPSQVKCLRCGVPLLVDTEMERKYSQGPMGLFIGSMDDLAQIERDINAVGVTCAVCGRSFCITCMKKYGKQHPKSGGLACLECGGHMTQFRG